MSTPFAASFPGDEGACLAAVTRPARVPSKHTERERVTAVVRRRVKADEYRAMAVRACAMAAASPLEQVRNKHERAAARWLALVTLYADASDQTSPAARKDDVLLRFAFEPQIKGT